MATFTELVAAGVSPTPFGIFDSFDTFKSEAEQMVTFVKRKLGDDILSVELTKKMIYAILEESTLEYAALLNQYKEKSKLLIYLGNSTGSDVQQK